MKLLRLRLGVDFRSLSAGFEIIFLREWDNERCFEFHPYCLAGRNGSGKSNVLEALPSCGANLNLPGHVQPQFKASCVPESPL